MDLDGSSQKVGGTKPDAVVDTSQFLAYGPSLASTSGICEHVGASFGDYWGCCFKTDNLSIHMLCTL
jgi:hypothetical protein